MFKGRVWRGCKCFFMSVEAAANRRQALSAVSVVEQNCLALFKTIKKVVSKLVSLFIPIVSPERDGHTAGCSCLFFNHLYQLIGISRRVHYTPPTAGRD